MNKRTKERSFGEEIVARLQEVVDVVERGEDIETKFTCRRVELRHSPTAYTPEMVRETRELLYTSQAVFAQLLGVSPAASPAELLSAFRRKARDVHPDVRPDDSQAQAQFQELADAYRAAAAHAALPKRRPRPMGVTLRTRREAEREAEPPIRATPTVVGPPTKRPGGRA